MKKLDIKGMGLEELDSKELETVEGGFVLSILIGLAIGAGIAYLTRSK